MGKKDRLRRQEEGLLVNGAPDAATAVTEKKRKKHGADEGVKSKKSKRQAGEEQSVDLNGLSEEGFNTSSNKEKAEKGGAQKVLSKTTAVEKQQANQSIAENGLHQEGAEKKKKKKRKDDAAVTVETEEKKRLRENGNDVTPERAEKQRKKEKTTANGGDAELTEKASKSKKEKKQKANRSGEETAHKEKKDSRARGGADLIKARANLNMVVTGRGADAEEFRPLKTFEEADLSETLLHGCVGFSSPSPIQAQAWPIALAGRDLIGIAKTGSGKTIAFAVPALSHITKLGTPPKSPACLVLAPTRELAIQIAEVFENAGKMCGIKSVCVYGGVPKGPQKAAIRNGATVVVATPGRLQDLLEEGACTLAQCGMLVLDEADRMLDLGFEPAIREIIALLPKSHQTSMFSATWPPEVAKLAAEFLRDPLKIIIGSEDLTANHDVTQIVEVCEPTGREPKLEQLLRKYHADRKTRVLVFVLYKKEAAQMESYLTRKGWKAVAIHGDKGQADRSRALQQFRDGTIPLLIATDVAARGLDIPNVEYVINYSFPLTAEDYVHRIGRTGRAGKKGLAHTFFTSNDKARAGELQNILREAGQKVPQELLAFGTTVKKKESKLYGAHFREVDMEAKATKISFDSDGD